MKTFLYGAIAGAAGTTAIESATYLDMALRGRPSSSIPAHVVRELALRAHIEPLAAPDDTANDVTKRRRSALGELSGHAIGIGIGAAYGLLAPLLTRTPAIARAMALGAAAMAAADVPAALLGATDPREWEPVSWLADIVPHMIYGMATVAVYDAIANPQ